MTEYARIKNVYRVLKRKFYVKVTVENITNTRPKVDSDDITNPTYADAVSIKVLPASYMFDLFRQNFGDQLIGDLVFACDHDVVIKRTDKITHRSSEYKVIKVEPIEVGEKIAFQVVSCEGR